MFWTVTVNVTLLPTLGVGLFTVLAIVTSAPETCVVWLLFTSGVEAVPAVATLVIVPVNPPLTVTWNVTVAALVVQPG